MRHAPLFSLLLVLPLVAASLVPSTPAHAATPIQVFLNGKVLPLTVPAVIQDGRTLMPVRDLIDAMGATLKWDAATRGITVTQGARYLSMKIDHHLACLSADCLAAATLSAPPQLIGSRTYVPIRVFAQTMGAKVAWDGQRNAVIIDTTKPPTPDPNPVTVTSVLAGQVITGPIPLQATAPKGNRIHYYLINPATGTGTIVAAGQDPVASYIFTPDPTQRGARLLIAGTQDEYGVYRYSDPVLVTLAPDPKVTVTGAQWGGLLDGPITFGSSVNFTATHEIFRLIDPATGQSRDLGTVGPGDSLAYDPPKSDSGDRQIQVVAYDRAGNAYPSEPIPIKVAPPNWSNFTGIAAGDVLTTGLANLRVSGNYPIDGVKYILDDRTLGWGFAYKYQFGPEANGPHTLRVEVTTADGGLKTFGPFNFTVAFKPYLMWSGIGPAQVVTGPTTLSNSSNVPLASVEFMLTDIATGVERSLGKHTVDTAYTFTPTLSGAYALHAVATTLAGQTLTTEPVAFRTFLGQIYGPQPVVLRSEFQAMSTKLSLPIYREVGMSAALQVAQSMLETGYGQLVPVDKYTGQLSYNLFGMKGTGPAGSIISNTWEEYNGISYRIDADFRAYHSVAENWRDHADLLLLRTWYAPFRAVMANPVLGAWGLRRSGYATDSQYPIKLINIMKVNGLYKLDELEL